jgi:hypothetical protein
VLIARPDTGRLAGLTTRADRHREMVALICRPSVFQATGCRVQQRQSSAADRYVEDRSALCGRPVFRRIEGYAVVLELHDDCRIGKFNRHRDVVLPIVAVRMSENVGDDLFEHELALPAGFLRQLTSVERPAEVVERTTERCARALLFGTTVATRRASIRSTPGVSSRPDSVILVTPLSSPAIAMFTSTILPQWSCSRKHNQISPLDPVTLGAATGILAIASLAASIRRAALPTGSVLRVGEHVFRCELCGQREMMQAVQCVWSRRQRGHALRIRAQRAAPARATVHRFLIPARWAANVLPMTALRNG